MQGNTFGRIFRVTSWGESHGPAIGVIIDGCPAGIPLAIDDFLNDMEQRQGGRHRFSTPRKEADQVEIESGVFAGRTTGTPISLRIENKSTTSKDYSDFKNSPRPGHADITTHWKHHHRDYRGGGRSSARETAARVAAGVVAKKILAQHEVYVFSYLSRVGEKEIPPAFPELQNLSCSALNAMMGELKTTRSENPLQSLAAEESVLLEYIDSIQDRKDSVGGEITGFAINLPRGLGEPIFDKLNAVLGHALFSLPAVVYVDCGGGRNMSQLLGSQIRDAISYEQDEKIVFKSNKHGGLLGGMTSGEPLWMKIGFHAPTSIPKEIESVDLTTGQNTKLSVGGRHDSFPLPRAIPIVEAMLAITIVDALFMQNAK